MEEKDEHVRLAKLVKDTHADLRRKYRTCDGDFDKVWEDHCSDQNVLSQYADAMHHLAVDHWTKHPETRIDWCRETAVEYFLKGGLEKTLQKDARCKSYKEHRNGNISNNCVCAHHEEEERPGTQATADIETDRHLLESCCNCHHNIVDLHFEGPVRLLDVGSCFNPFLEFDEFLAVGIDISPAKSSVYHCDFLHLELSEPLQVASDTLNTYMNSLKDPVERIPRESFHVVVFSLLLEYFPAPYQRWICCQKACELLLTNGLLLIVTPDSHKQHRNAPMMKSWKKAIESMGFSRWKYVKQDHIHCMAFRKILKEENSESSLINDISPDMLYIPQDFNSDALCEDGLFESVFDEESFRKALWELPALNIEEEEEEGDT